MNTVSLHFLRQAPEESYPLGLCLISLYKFLKIAVELVQKWYNIGTNCRFAVIDSNEGDT